MSNRPLTAARSRAILALAFATGCATAPVQQAGPSPMLLVSQRVDHIDRIAREPMLVEHPSGALFVAGYGSPHPTLWTSTDRGATWARVNVGGEAEGAVGNSDVDLAVAPDGTLYFATMTYDRKAFEGTGISMGVSTDAGVSWRWTALSRVRFDDRPWVEVAPDGAAHVIWNDGSGVSHRVSRDRGATWVDLGRIHDTGGSSHLAIGPAGEIAVRITPASASFNKVDLGVDLIAVSTDGGRTWRKDAAPGERDWAPRFDSEGFTPRWVEPIAWDANGALHSLWTDERGVNIARSADRGATWTSALVVPSQTKTFFPYLVGRDDGALAATWFSGVDDVAKDLRAHAAHIRWGAPGASPRVTLASPWSLESTRPGKTPSDPRVNDTGGEYLAVAFLRDRSLAVVCPIQNDTAKRMGFTFLRFRTP